MIGQLQCRGQGLSKQEWVSHLIIHVPPINTYTHAHTHFDCKALELALADECHTQSTINVASGRLELIQPSG